MITTIDEARAVNVVAKHLLRTAPSSVGGTAGDVELLAALALLADSAHRKYGGAGLTGDAIREAWATNSQPSADLPVAVIDGHRLVCPTDGGDVQQLEEVDHFNGLEIKNGKVHRLIDAGGLNYDGCPASTLCRSCLMPVALPLPLEEESGLEGVSAPAEMSPEAIAYVLTDQD